MTAIKETTTTLPESTQEMKEGDMGTSQHLSATPGVLRAEMEEETLPRCAEKVSRFLIRGAPCYVAVCCSSVTLGAMSSLRREGWR